MRECIVRGAILTLSSCLLSTSVAAQTTSRVAGPSSPTLMGRLELSLPDAVRMAIENNLDVELLRFEPLLAQQDVSIAWGAYDPEAFGAGGYAIDETPNANILVPTQQIRTQNTNGELGLRGLLPVVGGDYQISYAGNEELTNSAIQLLSPEFRSNFLLSARVPILRGLVWNEPWVQVRITEINSQRSVDAFRQSLMDIVAATEQKYWELVAAQEQTHVAEKSLETAQALLEQSQAQYEVGVVSRVDVVESEAGVADREFNLIRDRATEKNVQDELIDLVLGPFLAPKTVLEVVPTERPDERPVTGVDVETATEKAFEYRPELAVAREDVERTKVQAQFRRNQRLPQFDIEGHWGFNGLSGRTNPDCQDFRSGIRCREIAGSVPPGVGPSFWDANDRFFEDDGNVNYGIRGVVSFPLGNVRARHEYSKAQLELRQAETVVRRSEQQIVTGVRRAARNLEAAIEGIEAASRGEEFSAEQLRAERVRLEHGESTPFDVLLREEDLVRSQSQKIAAQRVYQGSVTELEREQGTILLRHNIRIEEAAALR